MKKIFLLAAFLSSSVLFGRNVFLSVNDSTGMLGDNFDLYGALDLFRQSSTPEDFENRLNDPQNHVNNLDLNYDGNIDYVRVIDNMDGDAHAVQLQVPVNENESQDVAVIELQRTGIAHVDAQIIGDPILYGDNYAIEPSQTDSVSTEGKFISSHYRFISFNTWNWPCVQHMYAPDYQAWQSPWHYGNLPSSFQSVQASDWSSFHSSASAYHLPAYQFVSGNTLSKAGALYSSRRTSSTSVREVGKAIRQSGAGANIASKVAGRKDNMSGQASGRHAKIHQSGEGVKGKAKEKAKEKAGNVIKPGVNTGIHR